MHLFSSSSMTMMTKQTLVHLHNKHHQSHLPASIKHFLRHSCIHWKHSTHRTSTSLQSTAGTTLDAYQVSPRSTFILKRIPFTNAYFQCKGFSQRSYLSQLTHSSISMHVNPENARPNASTDDLQTQHPLASFMPQILVVCVKRDCLTGAFLHKVGDG